MRILVVFTGGTIGSAVKDGYISPDSEKSYRLIEEYRKISPYHLVYSGIKSDDSASANDKTLHIATIEPYRILSENLNGDYINKLVHCLNEYVPSNSIFSSQEHYDGIIVTHGTDTLQYSAAALGYYFADSKIPIVMVSSNYILDDERANGLDNFYYAVEFIMQHSGGGVFVSYRNGEDNQLIHRAARLLPHAPYDDLVYSVSNQFYGEFVVDKFKYNSDCIDSATPYQNEHCISQPDTFSHEGTAIMRDVQLTDLSPVLYIKPLPGQIYPSIGKNVRAILLDSYHSGTICTSDPELFDFIKDSHAMNIPLFLTGAENRIGYESTKVYKELGINVLPKASPIAMYMKLWILCCADISSGNIYDAMCRNIGDDIIE